MKAEGETRTTKNKKRQPLKRLPGGTVDWTLVEDQLVRAREGADAEAPADFA